MEGMAVTIAAQITLAVSVPGNRELIMKRFGPGTNARGLLINTAWVLTIFPLSNEAGPCSPMNTQGLLGVISWLFMLIGAYAFYSGLFKFYDWFNKN